jgi:hypothetical protein
MMVFFVLLTLGFVFELGKNALTIDSRQTSYINVDISTPHAYVSGLRKLYVLSNSSTYAVWLGRFVYCILILLGIFLYIHFFSETIYCSSTNSWAHYLNQQIDYARLENALEKAMNAEIDKRAKMGATSSVVTFSDIGVKWASASAASQGFDRFEGLSRLVEAQAHIFQARGATKVTSAIAIIRVLSSS